MDFRVYKTQTVDGVVCLTYLPFYVLIRIHLFARSSTQNSTMVQLFKSFFVLAALATVGFTAPNFKRDVSTLETDLGNIYNQCSLVVAALTAFIQDNSVVSF